MDLQAQSAELKAAADKDLSICSTHAKVEVAAKEHVLLTAGGAYIKIAGGNIQIHAPGVVQFKAGMKELSGPTSLNAALPKFPAGDLNLSNTTWHDYAAQYQVIEGDKHVTNQPYVLKLPDGTMHFGEADSKGKTIKVGTLSPKDIKLTLLDKDEWEQENVNVWHQEMDRYWS